MPCDPRVAQCIDQVLRSVLSDGMLADGCEAWQRAQWLMSVTHDTVTDAVEALQVWWQVHGIPPYCTGLTTTDLTFAVYDLSMPRTDWRLAL